MLISSKVPSNESSPSEFTSMAAKEAKPYSSGVLELRKRCEGEGSGWLLLLLLLLLIGAAVRRRRGPTTEVGDAAAAEAARNMAAAEGTGSATAEGIMAGELGSD